MLNFKNFKHIHCVGIGGIGLSSIAEIFLSRGYAVSGSDLKASDITENLEKKGATIYFSHDESNIVGADLIIYTAAASSDNPEMVAAKTFNIPCISRASALGILMSDHRKSIAISGTHGKTTTTSMVSLVLTNASFDPTILVGGNLAEIDGNVRVGQSEYFVTEACEYVDSFLSLKPYMEIILNIDSDHLDFFKDIEHIADSFTKFAKLVPKDGYVIAYSPNPFVRSLIDTLSCNVITFGLDEHCDYNARNISFNNSGMPSFDIFYFGKELCSIHLSVPGEHNINNALASFACCHTLCIGIDSIKTTLEKFTGIQRRFDLVGITKKKVKIIDDYAHHPTEIKATLGAAQNISHTELWCIFQPHTYTRTIALFDDFAKAFEKADKIILTEIYAAREKNIHKISSKELVAKIKEYFPLKDVFFFENFEEIASFVTNNASSGDLVFTMGAGDIYKVGELIMEK